MSGHLHRDLSLGKILIKPAEFQKGGTERKGFEIPEEFLDGISSWSEKDAKEIQDLCRNVQEIVARLGISTEPSAVIMDSDLSVSWREYLKQGRRADESVSVFLGT